MAVDAAQTTLVVGPSWVGDMVMAQSLFMQLKHAHPGIAIDVLAPAWSRPLLERMPEVREAIDMPFRHGELGLAARYRLGRRLRARRYDWAIVLPNSFKSALAPFWARITRRTGYLGELRWGLLNDVRRLDRARLPMTVQRFVALGLAPDAPVPAQCPAPRLAVSNAQVTAALQRLGLSPPSKPLLALCPGAEYGPAKRWPVEYFAALAAAKIAQGWTTWVFGSDKDAALGETLCARVGAGCVNLAGRTRLAEAVDLLSLAHAVVSNDSGLMHIAAALDRPLVAVYGSSDPGFTPPLSARAKLVSLRVECSPCFKRECPYGHYKCLRDLSPERVLGALDELPAP
ncbi:MAG: lipopolysaccharide heptosyltransferase II [Gammaproteobacteria bacterium]|nr:lipopolysaccharide heptosyltransferase II [Gammaproteobacteria bacterium]